MKCVDMICALDTHKKFTCLFCNQTNDRPRRNLLLENLFLWKPYTMRYGRHSTERVETIYNGTNLSDVIRRIENHRIHILALQITLRTSLSLINERGSYSGSAKEYLAEADRLNEKLESFVKRLKVCERTLKSQPITLKNLVNQYRIFLRESLHLKGVKQEAASFILLCEGLSALDTDAIERMKTVDEQTIISNLDFITKYQADRLKTMIIQENSSFIDDIIRDVIYRRTTLQDKQKPIAELYLMTFNHPFHVFYLEQYEAATKMVNFFDEYEGKFNQFRDIYNQIDQIMFEYRDELSRKTLGDHSEENSAFPTNEQMTTFECSRLILIAELLRSETDQIGMELSFPQVTKRVHQWKQDPTIDPKIYELFTALEQDLLSLYNPEQPLMNLIPFRVGFIGNISVGKSALVNYLRSQNSNLLWKDRILAPTAVGQSTVGSLQFDEQHRCPITQTIVPIRYVDIEGCTDYSTKIHAATYFEQIRKADCDLYVILFTGQQGSFECSLEKEINERLGRPCWFVRSKVDLEFNDHFNEQITRRKHDYPDMDIDETEENELVEEIIEKIREKASHICSTSPENIFLVNANYHQTSKDHSEKFNSQTHPFDINLLSQRLIEAARQSYRQERIARMACMVCAQAIGTCFRQHCITLFLSSHIRAGIGAMFLPWGDQLSLIHTRFGMRLAMGIQDRSSLSKRLQHTVDAFESILLKYPLNINPNDLKSDEFDYLKESQSSSTTTDSTNNQNEFCKAIHLGREPKQEPTIKDKISSAVPTGTVTVGFIGKKIAVTTFALNALGYGIGVGFLGLSAVAAIPIGLWIMKKSNKQLRDYLDDLCFDLLIISGHFIIAIINQEINNQTKLS